MGFGAKPRRSPCFLAFASRLDAGLAESGIASLPDSCFLSLRDLGDGGYDWAAAQARLRGLPPQTPFFASRRIEAAEQRIHARNPSPRTRPAGRLVRVVTPVPGCRVSLLVSMGVMGFLGDLYYSQSKRYSNVSEYVIMETVMRNEAFSDNRS